MKEVLAFVIFALGISWFGNAQSLSSNRIFEKKANDYVVYLDRRDDSNQIFGILYRGENTYTLRSFDLATSQETIIDVKVKESPETIETQDVKLIKGKEEFSTYKESVISFFMILTADDKVERSSFPNDTQIDQTFGESPNITKQVMTYKFWVPLFNLYSIEPENSKVGSFRLVEFGKGGDRQPERFFRITSLPTIVDGPAFEIPPAKSKTVNFDISQLTLDANWKFESNSALLSIKTPRDSMLAFKDYNLDPTKSNIKDLGYLLGNLKMLQIGLPVDTQIVRIEATDNSIVWDYYVLNPDDRMLTHVFDVFKYSTTNKTNKMDNITIFSYGSLYLRNKDYFDRVVSEIVRN